MKAIFFLHPLDPPPPLYQPPLWVKHPGFSSSLPCKFRPGLPGPLAFKSAHTSGAPADGQLCSHTGWETQLPPRPGRRPDSWERAQGPSEPCHSLRAAVIPTWVAVSISASQAGTLRPEKGPTRPRGPGPRAGLQVHRSAGCLSVPFTQVGGHLPAPPPRAHSSS